MNYHYNTMQPTAPQMQYLPPIEVPAIANQMQPYQNMLIQIINDTLMGISNKNNAFTQDLIYFITANNFNSPQMSKIVNRLASCVAVLLFIDRVDPNTVVRVDGPLQSLPGDLMIAEYARMLGQNQPQQLQQNQALNQILQNIDSHMYNNIEPKINSLGQSQPQQNPYNTPTNHNGGSYLPYSAPTQTDSWRSKQTKGSGLGHDFLTPKNKETTTSPVQTNTPPPVNTDSRDQNGITHYFRDTVLPTELTLDVVRGFSLAKDRDGVFINESSYRPDPSEVSNVSIRGYNSFFGYIGNDRAKPELTTVNTLDEYVNKLHQICGTLNLTEYKPNSRNTYKEIASLGLSFYGSLFKRDGYNGFGFNSKPFGSLESQANLATAILGNDWQDLVDLDSHVKFIHFQGKEYYLFSSKSNHVYHRVNEHRGESYTHLKYNLNPHDKSRSEQHWYIFNQYFNTGFIVEDIYLEDTQMDLKRHIGLADETPIIAPEPTPRNEDEVVDVNDFKTKDLNLEIKTQRIVSNSAVVAVNRHVTMERLRNSNYTTENKEVVIEYQRTEPFLLRSENDIKFYKELRTTLNTKRVSLDNLVTILKNGFYAEEYISYDFLMWLDKYIGRRVFEHFLHSFGLNTFSLDTVYFKEHKELMDLVRADIPTVLFEEWLSVGQYDFVARCFNFIEDEAELNLHKYALLDNTNAQTTDSDNNVMVEATYISDDAKLPTDQELSEWTGVDINDLTENELYHQMQKDWLVKNNPSYLTTEWLPLTKDNFVVLKETVQLINTTYLLTELGISQSVEHGTTNNPRRVCGQNDVVNQLITEVDKHKPYQPLIHHQILTKDGYVVDVYRSPNDNTIVNYVLADQR